MELFCVALITGSEAFTAVLGVAVAVVCVALVRPKDCGACTMAKYIRNPPTPIMAIPIAATFAIVENSSRVGLLVSVKTLRYSPSLRSIAFREKRPSAAEASRSLEAFDKALACFLSSLGASRCFLGFDEGVPFFLAIVHSPN